MNRTIISHFATKDVPRARAFYTALGFSVDEAMSGETNVCMVISDTIRAMFSAEAAFASFSPKPPCDTSKCLEVLSCLILESRAEVDATIQKARAAGGSVFEEAEDHGFMYAHSFLDPDGHGWNLIHVPEQA